MISKRHAQIGVMLLLMGCGSQNQPISGALPWLIDSAQIQPAAQTCLIRGRLINTSNQLLIAQLLQWELTGNPSNISTTTLASPEVLSQSLESLVIAAGGSIDFDLNLDVSEFNVTDEITVQLSLLATATDASVVQFSASTLCSR